MNDFTSVVVYSRHYFVFQRLLELFLPQENEYHAKKDAIFVRIPERLFTNRSKSLAKEKISEKTGKRLEVFQMTVLEGKNRNLCFFSH